jgi:beta-phosphoglucomutase
MIKGVLFDMDGVLVDSESFICKAAIMMFGELGIEVKPEDFQPFVGMGGNRYIGGVA